MTNAHRDLGAPELWTRSLQRSRRRRELLPRARRELARRKHVSAALATAVVAGPATPLAAAQVSSGNMSAAVAAESPANRAIEIREGGLPLQLGSQGELVAEVQRALQIPSDGIFGVRPTPRCGATSRRRDSRSTGSSASPPGARSSRATRPAARRSAARTFRSRRGRRSSRPSSRSVSSWRLRARCRAAAG